MPRLRRYIHILRGIMFCAAYAMVMSPFTVFLFVLETTGNAMQALIDEVIAFFCLAIVFSIAYILEGAARQQQQ
ncbi:MAG: hypothetical protein L7G96_07540, partial [Vulcanisaeta sp.]|nr:hypothetical protein [Vulcanisaeta sp.]